MSDPATALQHYVEHHQMTVLRDEGVYRHVRFRSPQNEIGSFDLVTWPRHLVITGDIGDYHFARLDDMFEFFRSPVGHINASYWAEKLRRPQKHTSYSPDLFKRMVFEEFQERREWLPLPHRPLWQALREEVLSDDVIYDEAIARRALNGFRFRMEAETVAAPAILDRLPAKESGDFRPHRVLWPRRDAGVFEFADTWEWNLHEYDYHFLLSLHAIVWGINQYDLALKAVA
ncbi:hypothetical protein BCA37_10590 [Mycobacterium sp. djl-10]|nr:hypothetical protein BCA37_10590 [Mycobacterium sp. djl-10]